MVVALEAVALNICSILPAEIARGALEGVAFAIHCATPMKVSAVAVDILYGIFAANRFCIVPVGVAWWAIVDVASALNRTAHVIILWAGTCQVVAKQLWCPILQNIVCWASVGSADSNWFTTDVCVHVSTFPTLTEHSIEHLPVGQAAWTRVRVAMALFDTAVVIVSALAGLVMAQDVPRR